MAEIVASVDVNAPVEAVWAAVTDWERQSEWITATVVRATHQQGRGVGGRIEAFTGFGGLVGFRDPMEITAWDPPRRCLVRHTGRLVRGAAVFEVEALPHGRARFLWAEWLDLPLGLLGAVGFAVVRPAAVAGIRISLRRFARWVESTNGAAALVPAGEVERR